jgi:hypothetical protein
MLLLSTQYYFKGEIYASKIRMNWLRYRMRKYLREIKFRHRESQVISETKIGAMYVCAWNAVPYPGWGGGRTR